jgi:arginyl-tRNA synthetase
LALLNNEYEQALIKQLSRYADTLKNAALNYEPHVLAYYLRDLAGDFHSSPIKFPIYQGCGQAPELMPLLW